MIDLEAPVRHATALAQRAVMLLTQLGPQGHEAARAYGTWRVGWDVISDLRSVHPTDLAGVTPTTWPAALARQGHRVWLYGIEVKPGQNEPRSTLRLELPV